jgi:hypothetical protein
MDLFEVLTAGEKVGIVFFRKRNFYKKADWSRLHTGTKQERIERLVELRDLPETYGDAPDEVLQVIASMIDHEPDSGIRKYAYEALVQCGVKRRSDSVVREIAIDLLCQRIVTEPLDELRIICIKGLSEIYSRVDTAVGPLNVKAVEKVAEAFADAFPNEKSNSVRIELLDGLNNYRFVNEALIRPIIKAAMNDAVAEIREKAEFYLGDWDLI